MPHTLPRLLIRCDSSPEIGVGHVLRCLAFASLWPDPAKVTFISDLGGAELAGRIREAGHKLLELTPRGSENAASEACRQFENPESWLGQKNYLETAPGAEDSILLLDGYHFSSALQKQMRPLVKKLIVWDDCNHLAEYHAHIILNDGPGFQARDYQAPAGTIFLLGPEYILLRPEFLAQTGARGREAAPVADKILISFGGADPRALSLEALRFLLRFLFHPSQPGFGEAVPALQVKVVAGAAYGRLSELRELAAELNRRGRLAGTSGQAKHSVEILHNVSDMPGLMLWADLALGAAGGTAFELCYLGVPQLLCVAAENQRAVARWLTGNGAARPVESFERLPAEEFLGLLRDKAGRQAMSRAALRLVDGRGRERLRRFITELCAGSSANDTAG